MTLKAPKKDPRLGRRYQPDPRNSHFPIRAMLPRVAYEKPITKIWDCSVVLDQGQEGSCVGNGFAHELIAMPFPIEDISEGDAVSIYKLAQTLDDFPSEDYVGTSVIAGAKATQALFPGAIESFRWATTLSDVVATIGYHGPVVIGVNWYEGMNEPNPGGMVELTGDILGGHCGLLRGVDIDKKALLFHNSYGAGWGADGTCWIGFDDFARLLRENGEACIIISRGWWRRAGVTN